MPKLGLIVTILGIAFCSTSAKAQALLYCDQPEKPGLYKQCQEVTLLQRLGNISRVFGKVEKKVLTVSSNLIFSAQSPQAQQKISPQTLISIPGSYLWNNSPEGYQSLCKVNEDRGRLLEVSCGRFKNETIARQHVFSVTSVTESKTKPTSYQP